MQRPPHREEMAAALECERRALEAMLAGDRDASIKAFAETATHYRASWDTAPPGSYGRLIGMLKASILAGDAESAAEFAEAALANDTAATPTAAYVRALAALVAGRDVQARTAAAQMVGGSPAFDRTAAAIVAIADRDGDAYVSAVGAIVADFEQRPRHLTGVAVADTAAMLQALAAERGISAQIESELLPNTGG